MTPAELRRAADRCARAALVSVDPATGEPFVMGEATAERYWREFVRAGGLVLDPAMWRTGEGAETAVAAKVEEALRRGIGADTAVAEWLSSGGCSAVARDPFGPWQLYGAPAVTRLFVREINRAYKGRNKAAETVQRQRLKAQTDTNWGR